MSKYNLYFTRDEILHARDTEDPKELDEYMCAVPPYQLISDWIYMDEYIKNSCKWIDVKDKLPANEQPCIIRINRREGPEINYGVYNAEFKQFNNYDELMFDIFGGSYGVTHWMPVPEFKE